MNPATRFLGSRTTRVVFSLLVHTSGAGCIGAARADAGANETVLPDSISGLVFVITIEGGSPPYASSGSYEFRPANQGNTYEVRGRAGFPESTGTYAYTKLEPTRATLQFVDSLTGPGFVHTQTLRLQTPTSGAFTLQNATGTGRQSGSFIILSPVVNGPAWTWVRATEGTGRVIVNAARLDGAGDLYVAGSFGGTVRFGSFQLEATLSAAGHDVGDNDAFVAKLTPQGEFLWVHQFGGNQQDEAWGLDLDPAGQVLVCGLFTDTGTFGNQELTSAGSADMFLIKLTASGEVLWSRRAGGPGFDAGWNLTADTSGAAYACGQFEGTASFGNTDLTALGEGVPTIDVFVAKYDADGNLLWTRQAGGTGYDGAYSVAGDPAGNIYLAGTIMGTADFGQISSGPEAPFAQALFVAKMNPAGDFLWVRSAGSTAGAPIWGSGLAATASGGVYLTGVFTGAASFGDTVLTTAFPSPDGFLTRLDSSGQFAWAFQFGGSEWDEGWNVRTDSQDHAYVVGSFSGDATFGNTLLRADEGPFGPAADGFLAKIDPSGALEWIKQVEGTGTAVIRCVAENGAGDVFVAGEFEGPARWDQTALDAPTGRQAFFAKLADPDAQPTAPSILSHPQSQEVVAGQSVTLHVAARGTGPLSYQWQKNGSAISDATEPSFTLANFQPADAGRYRVRVSNSLGAATSNEAVLAVHPGPRVLAAWRAGGNGSDQGFSAALNQAGNAFVAGRFETMASFGGTTLTSRGADDVLLVKVDPLGQFVWAKRAGSPTSDQGRRVLATDDGGAVVTGRFTGSANFGDMGFSSQGSDDAFLTKLSASGDFVWTLVAGGPNSDYGYALARDRENNSYWGGRFQGAAVFGALNLTAAGANDAFLVKVDPGGKLLWARKLGGSGEDWAKAIATTATGEVVLAGYFSDSAAFGTQNLTSAGNTDVFLARLHASGEFLWAKRFGGAQAEEANAVITDAAGNIYLGGNFLGSVQFGQTTLTSRGERDVFLVKLNHEGVPLWAIQFGGPAWDEGWEVASATDGGVYVTGLFASTAGFGGFNLTSRGLDDAFLAKVNPSGSVVWAKQGGGAADDEGWGVAADRAGAVLFTGAFAGTARFDESILESTGGSRDIFLVRLDDVSAPVILVSPQDQVVSEEALAVLSVVAGGSEPLTYQWRKDGREVAGATAATLRLLDVTPSDAGQYSVEVSNALGQAISPPVTLGVQPLPGALDPAFAPDLVDGFISDTRVTALAVQPDRRLLIAANTLDGGIARFHADGRRDYSFNPGEGIDAFVEDINVIVVQPDRKILIGGDFERFDGANRPGLARLHPDGSLDRDFNLGLERGFIGGSPWLKEGIVAIVLDATGRILFGGDFTAVNGVPRPGVARLLADGSLDAAFVPPAGVPLQVQTLVIQPDGRTLVGGVPLGTAAGGDDGGAAREDALALAVAPEPLPQPLLRLQVDGRIDGTFNPVFEAGSPFVADGFPGEVHCLAVQPDGKIIVGGSFSSVNGVPRNSIVRLSANGMTDLAFDPGSGVLEDFGFGPPNELVPGEVKALILQPDSKVVLAGVFDLVDGQSRGGVARLNADGSLDEFFSPGGGINGGFAAEGPAALSLGLQADGQILVGGRFTRFGQADRDGIARLAGGDPLTFAPYLLVEPSDQTVVEGGAARLQVVVKGFPTPVFEWRLNGVRVEGATQSALTIPTVQSSHTGEYEVVARNNTGEVVTRFRLSLNPAEAAHRFLWAQRAQGLSSGAPMGGEAETATDSQGNVFLVGTFRERLVIGGLELTNDGFNAEFVLIKLTSEGQAAWAVRGETGDGPAGFSGLRLAVDAEGNSYVVGWFGGREATFGSAGIKVIADEMSTSTVFVLKCNPDGEGLWVRKHPGSAPAGFEFTAIAVDPQGQAVIAGEVSGAITFADLTLDPAPFNRLLLAAYDADGNPQWGRAIQGGMVSGRELAADGSGNVFLCGEFYGGMAPIDFSGLEIEVDDPREHFFLARYRADGQIGWVRTFSGDGPDLLTSDLATDQAGNAVLVGEFGEQIDFDGTVLSNPIGQPSEPRTPTFLAKFDPLGEVVWAVCQSGSSGAWMSLPRIAITSQSQIVVAGDFEGAGRFGTTVIPEDADLFSRTFLAKYDGAGNLIWVRTVGNPPLDLSGLAADPFGNIVVAGGLYEPTAFDDLAVAGTCCVDQFLAKLAPNVPDRPPGILHSRSSTVHEGGSIELRAFAASTNPVRYQWRLNGVALPGETLETLWLENFSAAKSGNYSVAVTNAVGTTFSQPISLTLGPALRMSEVSLEPDGVTIYFYALRGSAYRLERTDDLQAASWDFVAWYENPEEDSVAILRDSAPAAARRFYRVQSIQQRVDDLAEPTP